MREVRRLPSGYRTREEGHANKARKGRIRQSNISFLRMLDPCRFLRVGFARIIAVVSRALPAFSDRRLKQGMSIVAPVRSASVSTCKRAGGASFRIHPSFSSI